MTALPSSKEALSEALAFALGGAAPAAEPASLLGLEHEYRLTGPHGPADFRHLIHRARIPGYRIDPGDANAYRLESGLALTCDDADAEIAAPPVPLRPGFTYELQAWAVEGRRQITEALPTGVNATGFSTHYSASLPNELQLEALRLFGRHFAPAAILLAEPRESFGIYLRPRPGRLELCGDYAGGRSLRAGATFFAAAVRACAAAATVQSGGPGDLPPPLDVRLKPARGRYGFFLGRRTAFGYDFYTAGREARLPVEGGGAVTAQEHLSAAWHAAAPYIAADAADDEIDLVSRMVSGAAPLASERADDLADDGAFSLPPRPDVAGRILMRVSRPRFSVEPFVATWDFTVLRLRGEKRAYLNLSRGCLARFLDLLPSGALDAVIEGYLASEEPPRRLSGYEDTATPGLWDAVGPSRDLLPREPDPITGRYAATGAEDAASTRSAKHRDAARPLKALPFLPPPQAARPHPESTAEPAAPPVPAPPTGDHPPRPVSGSPDLPATPPGRPYLPVVAGVLIIAAVVAVALSQALGGGGATIDERTPTPVATRSPSATPSSVAASPTLVPVVDAVASQTAAPASPTSTARPLDPTRPPASPTAPAPATAPPAAATETPRPTQTSTTAPSASPTPSPISTATPTIAPSRTPEVTATPAATATCGPPGTTSFCTPTPVPTSTPVGPGGPATE